MLQGRGKGKGRPVGELPPGVAVVVVEKRRREKRREERRAEKR